MKIQYQINNEVFTGVVLRKFSYLPKAKFLMSQYGDILGLIEEDDKGLFVDNIRIVSEFKLEQLVGTLYDDVIMEMQENRIELVATLLEEIISSKVYPVNCRVHDGVTEYMWEKITLQLIDSEEDYEDGTPLLYIKVHDGFHTIDIPMAYNINFPYEENICEKIHNLTSCGILDAYRILYI